LTKGHLPVELGDYTWPYTRPKCNWWDKRREIENIWILHLFTCNLLMLSLTG